MALLTRMFRLCKADLHGVMDQLEDKDLLLKQYIREMEEGLMQKGTRQAKLRNSCQQIQRDLDLRRSEMVKIEKEIELAVTKEKDEIARMLIRKRLTLTMACDQLQRQLEVLEEENAGMAETLATQRLRYEQLKIKAAAFSRLTEQQRFAMTASTVGRPDDWQTPSEEEIELELLQRKEALAQGGAS